MRSKMQGFALSFESVDFIGLMRTAEFGIDVHAWPKIRIGH